MNDSTELKTCGLELQGGYHGHPYPQTFVRAPKSDYPMKASSQGKAVSQHEIMSMCMGK